MSRVLLVVDLSYQVYRASAAHKNLSCGRIFTGGLFGFLTTLAKQIRETRATHLVIGQDMKPYKRSELYPDYKMLRKKNADEELVALFKEALPMVLDLAHLLELPVMAVPGFEFDDCVAGLVQVYSSRFDMIYAASNDSDLNQLLWCDNFRVLRQDLKDAIGAKELAAGPLGLTPAEVVPWLALQGTHNDVAGIPGVGPVTALKVIRSPSLMRTYREKHAALIERNTALIRLPHAEFPRAKLPPRPGFFNVRDLYRFCGRYDVTVTQSMLDSLLQVHQ